MRLLKMMITACLGVAAADARLTQSFDADWRFLQADVAAAQQPQFDDSGWRQLAVPHDWSIAGPFAETNKTGGAGAFLPSGVAWYRKRFVLPPALRDQRVWIEFDGVMQNSEVWINGHPLGTRPLGYVSFGYDLTPHLNVGPDATNVIAVRADTSAQPASRWYSGAGIYRHVRLVLTDALHLERHATFVTTPAIGHDRATIRVATRVLNDSAAPRRVTLVATVYGPPGSAPDGSYACSAESPSIEVPAKQGRDATLDIAMPWAPRLWDVQHPDLHRVAVRIIESAKTVDEETVPFGIREATFTADAGFLLNGKKVVLKGVCLHHDGSAFGAAVPNAVWERRLKTLREVGCNAIRTAHNPPSPDFLDLCDRMGFLVMDEFFDCWTVRKKPYDYSLFFTDWSKRDAADTIRRDRNHPSVVLYSVGNEIHDTTNEARAKGVLRGLVDICHTGDPTRPVTQALFRPNVSHDYDNGLADMLDVIGTNYRDAELLAAQRAKPERKILGTEQGHDRQTWLALRDHPTYCGQFLWTGVDYLGEARSWPVIGHAAGLLTRTASVKPMAFERQSWWSERPMVRIVRRVAPNDVMPDDPGYGGEERHTQVQYADWTPRKLDAHVENVEVYSNCDEVELFLNGKSLGTKPLNANAAPRNWMLPFEPGTLRAVASNHGQPAATDELRSAGKAATIVLSSDRSKIAPVWDELAFISAAVVDANGVLVPTANNLISFQLSGPGVIAAVDSADNSSHESFQASQRKAFQGECEAAVHASAATGTITLRATAPGLTPASITLDTRPAN